jgi:hypothetical protein
MTVQIFDQFNKKLFQQLLSPFGTVTPNRSVLGGERSIDILFEPAPGVQLDADELGNLASMSGQTSLFEPFRSSLSDQNLHNCFIKLFLLFAEIQREADGTVPTQNLPQLWILAAEVSDILIREFSGVPDSAQGEGFYRLATRLRTTIVVIDELPVTPDTLWLRPWVGDELRKTRSLSYCYYPNPIPNGSQHLTYWFLGGLVWRC